MADNSGNNTTYILDSTKIELELGKTTTIEIFPSPGPDDNVSWSTQYKNNVSIVQEEHGKVTVKGLVGSSYSYITATVNGKEISPSCKVSVFCIPVESISISTSALSMEVDDTKQLSAKVYPTNATVKTIKWNSSDERIATVDQQGNVRAIGGGVAVISAVSEGKDSNNQYLSKECVVSVGKFVSIDDISNFADKYAKQFDSGDTSQYSITLNKFIEGTNSCEVTLTQGTSVAKGEVKDPEKQTSTTITITSLLLTSISYHKEMYHPGCLELLIETTAPLSSFTGTVSLKYSSLVVASKYYIFEKKKKGRYVTLKAYSVDKFLTIDKFSQAFTGKLLVDEIIEGTLAKYKENHYFQKFCTHITPLPSDDTTSTDANPNNLWQYTISNLQHLSIAKKSSTRYKILNGAKTLISKINEDDLKKAKDYYEVEPVLPYNVQFEESFHDFLVRVCNRNGEFLYVEDNNLCIGIPEATDNATALTESGYEIEYTEEEESCDYTTISNRTEFPAEYYKPIREKDDDFAKKEDYYIPGAISLNLIKPIVESPHILDAIAPTAMACGGIFGVSELFKKQANDGFKKNFGDYTKANVFQFVDDGTFGNDFYANILKNEKLAEQKKLIVTSSTYKHHKLGDTVKVDNNPYVVYLVRGGAKIMDGVIESQEIKRYKEEFEMVLIPYIGTETDGSTSTTYSPYPIPLPRKNTIKPSTQRATVSANNDPMRLGRVRVLFDWQDSEDLGNASPWINMASPMASQESGFMFLPAKGDTVLVDFEDGNVENPYVVGSFYREDRLPSYHASTQNGPLVKSITSANGHHLTFTDLPGSKFGANLWPFSYFAKFGFLDGLSTTGDYNKLGGGFELADYYGFYSITGSTHDRKVSIKSPYGDVSIDAFHGITISAPSGNIKIEGKNVDIIARNNLSITSGTNIANPRFYSNSAAGYNKADKSDPNNSWNVTDFFLLKHLLQPMAGAAMKMTIDLSLYRTWFESIFRPIGGTMLIKSHRFMRLEAGKGQTAINSSKGSLKTDSKKQTTINLITSSFKALGNYAFDAKENIVPDNVWTSIIAVQGKIVDAYNKYTILWSSWNSLKQNIINKYNSLAPNTFGEELNDIDAVRQKYLEYVKGLDRLVYESTDYTKELNNQCLSMINTISTINNFINSNLEIDFDFLRDKCNTWNTKMSSWLTSISITNAGLDTSSNPPMQELLLSTVEAECRKCIYNNIRKIWNKQENSALKDLIQIKNIDNIGSDTLPATFDEKYLKENITITHNYDHKHALRLMGVAAGGMGLTGIMDDRSWSKKDTGNILLSAEAGKMYRFGADGSFKAYMPDEANAWRAFIIKMIRGAKINRNRETVL
ncbi:MAG: Ig-like domain-containing protein [Bacteroidaceae bacterium]|nr:Ig-like domain-containing protein [Bacteroidaceae bacterium]